MARWGIGGLCAVLLVSGSIGAWRTTQKGVKIATTTTPADPRLWDVDHIHDAQFDCMRDQIDRVVPAGSRVFVGDESGSPEPDLWQQRLTELSFRHTTIVSSAEQADIVLRVVRAPTTTSPTAPAADAPATPAPCWGLLLDVKAR